jgi:hypothetical protein
MKLFSYLQVLYNNLETIMLLDDIIIIILLQ